jgi:inhibitor of KinA
MPDQPTYRIFPLGDSAIMLDYGNIIDEKVNRQVIAMFRSLKKNPLPGMTEAVPAYSSLTIYYDLFQLGKQAPPGKTVYEWMAEQIEQHSPLLETTETGTSLVKIPVCYASEFAPDLEEMAAIKKMEVNDIIRIHTSKTYRVYMLGFLPGFAYMGEVDEQIEMPRKSQPRQRVEAGSVGIAGRQTGVYPLTSPGGWQIIGRTPASPQSFLKERASEDSLSLFRPGDIVQFYSISKDEFAGLS